MDIRMCEGGSVMINEYINELVAYGLNQGLVDPEDEVYVTNRLLELFQLTEHEGTAKEVRSERELSQILNDMLEYACRQGMLEEETITEKDLFDTKIMGILTPNPSVVRRQFWDKYSISPKTATDFYYQFSQATNYIRKERIAKDEKWTANTEFGAMDITINLSKPEKDPRDIAKAGKAKKSGYPSCLLCKEMKVTPDIFLIRQDKITELFRLHCVENSTIYSIRRMCTITNIVLSSMIGIFQ